MTIFGRKLAWSILAFVAFVTLAVLGDSRWDAWLSGASFMGFLWYGVEASDAYLKEHHL